MLSVNYILLATGPSIFSLSRLKYITLHCTLLPLSAHTSVPVLKRPIHIGMWDKPGQGTNVSCRPWVTEVERHLENEIRRIVLSSKISSGYGRSVAGVWMGSGSPRYAESASQALCVLARHYCAHRPGHTNEPATAYLLGMTQSIVQLH